MFFCFIWLIIHRFYISRCSKLFYNIKVGSSHICRTVSWSFFLLKCANRDMQAFRRSSVGRSLSFTTVHFSFTNVHHTFILVQKTSMKMTAKQTPDVMSYDYAPSCRTTIGAHVVRS